VTPGIDLSTLSQAEKDELILSLVGQLEAALARIAELETRLARFERPAKTPDNSSLPPSKGQKPDRPAGEKPPRKSRPGFGRTLHPNPDRVIDARLAACPKCQAMFPDVAQTPQQVERIELPPIKPDVTQVRLFGGRCACCGERVIAAAPAGLEPGSPFGQSIAALVVYLHYAHAIGMQRLVTLLDEIFLADHQRGCGQQHAGPCA
jgi:transposase